LKRLGKEPPEPEKQGW